jgi:hypothetical protein
MVNNGLIMTEQSMAVERTRNNGGEMNHGVRKEKEVIKVSIKMIPVEDFRSETNVRRVKKREKLMLIKSNIDDTKN